MTLYFALTLIPKEQSSMVTPESEKLTSHVTATGQGIGLSPQW